MLYVKCVLYVYVNSKWHWLKSSYLMHILGNNSSLMHGVGFLMRLIKKLFQITDLEYRTGTF